MGKSLTIKATPAFDRIAEVVFTSKSLEDLYDHLENHPKMGGIIQGTSGVRKLRWKTGKDNKGKRGGARVLYHYSDDILILLISVYSKTDKENISQSERNKLKQLIPELVAQYKKGL